MIATRVEKHVIKRSHTHYDVLDGFLHAAKNLWNHGNYEIRNYYASEGKYLDYYTLDKILKSDLDYPDYRRMPSAASAQQLLRLLDKSWKSFFASIKDWKAHPDKYQGRPKLPKYKRKNGRTVLTFTSQEARFKDGVIRFPKTLSGFTIKPQCIHKDNFASYQQVRFVPKLNYIVAEIVYKVHTTEMLEDNGRYASIDLGVDNLVTLANNCGSAAVIISGKPVKAANQWYNKITSHYRSCLASVNDRHNSHRLDRITRKRNAKINDYMHKVSHKVIEYCLERDICKLVIGYNEGWKQKCNIGKKNNQKFVEIPFLTLINQIEYKANEVGIEVILVEESYTSGTSFVDGEEPTCEHYDKSRRIHRGLFRTNSNLYINADLNGAYQIMKKVFPIKWDSRCALHPVIVSVE